MSRRKKPEDETKQQAVERRIKETISNHATRSEKTSWLRLFNNLTTKIDEMRPIEDQILELQNLKAPMIDDVIDLRRRLVQNCIHPYEQLVIIEDSVVKCKFCERTLRATNVKAE